MIVVLVVNNLGYAGSSGSSFHYMLVQALITQIAFPLLMQVSIFNYTNIYNSVLSCTGVGSFRPLLQFIGEMLIIV